MLVPVVMTGRLHILPKRNVPTYAIMLKIGIRKEEETDVLVDVHATEATCAIVLAAWLRRGTCCSIMA